MNDIEYKSQFGQDKFLIEKIFQRMEGGYFVEIGAGDGIHISNTYVLEKNFNWNGLCVECNPHSFKKLVQNRKCSVFDKPITHHGEIVDFNAVDDYGYYNCLFSSIYNIPEDYKNNATVLQLKSELLEYVLNLFNVPDVIDYLSLDIEGGEYEILISFFEHNKNRTIKCLTVEHNFDNVKRNKIKLLLEDNNYVCLQQFDVDDLYIKKELV